MLHEIIHENVREGKLYEKLDRKLGAVFCLRALLQDPPDSRRGLLRGPLRELLQSKNQRFATYNVDRSFSMGHVSPPRHAVAGRVRHRGLLPRPPRRQEKP